MSAVATIPTFHEAQRGHVHRTSDVRGYLVVRTDWTGPETTREPIAFHEIEPEFRAGDAKYTNAYGDALETVHAVRESAGAKQHGVIDTIYDCGCRLQG